MLPRKPLARLVLVNLYPGQGMARYLLSSYGLKAYLDKALRDVGDQVTVEVVNFDDASGPDSISSEILARRPDGVAYSCYVWNIETILRAVAAVRIARPELIQVLGGPEISISRISSLPDPALADYYVIGEGERVFAKLVQYLTPRARGAAVELPHGVARWDGGCLSYSADDDRMVDLDELPSVYLTGTLDSRLYSRGQAFLETQRGCTLRCKYCVYHKQRSTLSWYSVERVLAELDHLIIDQQVGALRICDPIFTSDLPRAKRIVRHLGALKNSRRQRLPWLYWEFTHDTVDAEFLELTAALKNRSRILNSGALPPLDRPQMYSDMLADYTVVNCVGVQSLCPEALRAVGRPPVELSRFTSFMAAAGELNIALKLDLILGLPFETLDSYFDGLDLLVPFFRNSDHVLNVHRLQVLPGSALEALCEVYAIRFSRAAPHTVSATSTLSSRDLGHAARSTALLARLLNSPLRRHFFAAKERTGMSVRRLVEAALRAVQAAPELLGIPLLRAAPPDDDYWNGRVFSDLPSDWLLALLDRIGKA